jgi:DNA polymerase-3 subunit delta'
MQHTLYGHTEVERQLALLLAAGRFPHAVMLHGPEGIGKRVLAEKLAWRLICGPAQAPEAGPDMFGEAAPPVAMLEMDTTAPAWYQLEAGSCPDFYVVTPEEGKKSVGVKQVQDLLEALVRTADTARVVVVDSLEDLTVEAANTLLKTLEEPRPGIFFILIAHQLSAVLPTIRSRCRLVAMQPLPLADVKMVLKENGVAETLAEVARGCPGVVMGAAAAQRTQLEEALAAGEVPPMQTPHLMDVLMQEISLRAGQAVPTWGEAEAFRQIANLKGRMEALNLPVNLVQEAAYEMYRNAKKGRKS